MSIACSGQVSAKMLAGVAGVAHWFERRDNPGPEWTVVYKRVDGGRWCLTYFRTPYEELSWSDHYTKGTTELARYLSETRDYATKQTLLLSAEELEGFLCELHM